MKQTKKQPADLTMDLLKNSAKVINPVEDIIELEKQIQELGTTMLMGSKTSTTTSKFFAEQEEKIKEVKSTYYNYVKQAGLDNGIMSEHGIFRHFDFYLQIIPKD